MQKDVENVMVPVLSSPKKKLSTEEIKNWNIPPCISNWKNSKGYTIPLHMRLMADMRGNKDMSINNKFGELADVINLTEKQFRKDIEERNKIKDCKNMMESIKNEKELLKIAEQVKREKQEILDSSNINIRSERSILTNKTDDTMYLLGNKRFFNEENDENNNQHLELELQERNKLREITKKNLNNEIRFASKINSKLNSTINTSSLRNNENEVSQISNSNELLIDSRLYNHTSGLDSGFKDDDEYDLFDKPLFSDYSKINKLNDYKPTTNTGGNGSSIDFDTKNSKNIIDKLKSRNNLFEK